MIFILGVDLSLPCFSLIQDFFTGSFQQGILNTIHLFFPSEEKGVIFCHSWHTTSVFDLNSTILGVTATNYKFNLNNSNLNPWFVTGFSDGDSSFWVSIIPNKNLKIRYEIKPGYSIIAAINPANLNLMILLDKFFGEIGSLRIDLKTNMWARI